MTYHCSFLSLALASFFLVAAGVPNAFASEESNWVFKIRQDADDKNSIEKPARFHLTDPDNGDTQWAADVGIIVVAPPFNGPSGSFQFESALNFEYHRQTAPSDKQDSLLTGLSGNWVIGDLSGPSGWAHWVPLNIQYKRDDEKKADGLQVTLDYLPVVSTKFVKFGQRITFGGDETYQDKRDLLRIEFQPKAGLEYEGVYDAPSGTPMGRIWRVHLNSEIAVFPLAGADFLDERFQIFGSLSYWRILDASSERMTSTGESLDLFEVGARYFLGESRNASFAVSYLDGENPRKSKPSQEYWLFAVEFKL